MYMYYSTSPLQYVTQNSACTRQNTLYLIILKLIPMYEGCLEITRTQ